MLEINAKMFCLEVMHVATLNYCKAIKCYNVIIINFTDINCVMVFLVEQNKYVCNFSENMLSMA